MNQRTRQWKDRNLVSRVRTRKARLGTVVVDSLAGNVETETALLMISFYSCPGKDKDCVGESVQ